MTLEDIQKLWAEDSKLNQLDLVHEALRIPSLHEKYYKIFVQEKMKLVQMAHALKAMELTKFELYTEGPHSEIPAEWKNRIGAEKGKIIKSAVDPYLEADPDLIDSRIKLTLQTEKTKFVESIISGLRERGFAIKNAIDMLKFQSGA